MWRVVTGYTSRNIIAAGLLGVVCLALFTVGIWNQGYIGFETRFALFAREMFANGPGWFPTAFGQPYPDYPAMSTWLIYLVACVFGEVNKFTTVFPTAVCSAITVALAYHLLSHYNRQWAIYSTVMFLLTITFASEARAISLDQSIATISMIVFYLVWRAERRVEKSIPWLIWPLLVLGFSIRGPLGVVIPSAGVVVFYLCHMQWRKLVIYGVVSVLLLGLLWAGLLALAESVGGQAFKEEVIRMQIGGRIYQGKSPEFFYYFSSALGNYAFAYPFAVLGYLAVLFAVYQRRGITNENEKLVLVMGAWALVILLGLSIPDTKKARYLLSMTFPLCVIASYLMYQQRQGIFAILRRMFLGIVAVIPALLAIALYIARGRAGQNGLSVAHYPVLGLILILAGMQLALVGWAFYGWRRRPALRGELSLAVLAFWLVTVVIIEPAELEARDSRQFVRLAEQVRQELKLPLVFYQVNADVLGKLYAVNADQLVYPQFITDPVRLADFPSGAFLVTREDRSAELLGAPVRTNLAVHGSMDHVPFVGIPIIPQLPRGAVRSAGYR